MADAFATTLAGECKRANEMARDGNFTEAIRLWRDLAKKGVATAAFNVGVMTLTTEFKNTADSLKYLTQAIAAGVPIQDAFNWLRSKPIITHQDVMALLYDCSPIAALIDATASTSQIENPLPLWTLSRDKTINILTTGGNLVGDLIGPNGTCDMLGRTITASKLLGQGKYGSAYEISFQGSGASRYVAKRTKPQTQKFPDGDDEQTLLYNGFTFQDLSNKYGIPASSIIEYNELDAEPHNPIRQYTESVAIPLFIRGCTVEADEDYEHYKGTGVTIFEMGDFVCPSSYSEYAISLVVAWLARTGTSINFIDTFDFATCPKGIGAIDQYTFMEQIDTTLGKTFPEVSIAGAKEASSPKALEMKLVVVQLLHAIACYQILFQINHNDLHPENIFLERVTDSTMWMGKRIHDYDWFEYRVGSNSLYIPRPQWLVKIGDWGLACKYSPKRIGQEVVFQTGYDQFDGLGPLVPNWFSRAYDVVYSLYTIYTHAGNANNPFLKNIMAWCMGIAIPATQSVYAAAWPRFRHGKNESRPLLAEIDYEGSLGVFAEVTPEKILTNPVLMADFQSPPTMDTDRILLAGVV